MQLLVVSHFEHSSAAGYALAALVCPLCARMTPVLEGSPLTSLLQIKPWMYAPIIYMLYKSTHGMHNCDNCIHAKH